MTTPAKLYTYAATSWKGAGDFAVRRYQSGPPFGGDVLNLLTCLVNILSVNDINMFKYSPLALRIPPGGSGSPTLDTHFRPFFVSNFGSIFDVVFDSKMGHFWNPKYAQMSPNGDPQMCLHNDVSKNRFSVIICQIFDLFNTRR